MQEIKARQSSNQGTSRVQLSDVVPYTGRSDPTSSNTQSNWLNPNSNRVWHEANTGSSGVSKDPTIGLNNGVQNNQPPTGPSTPIPTASPSDIPGPQDSTLNNRDAQNTEIGSGSSTYISSPTIAAESQNSNSLTLGALLSITIPIAVLLILLLLFLIYRRRKKSNDAKSSDGAPKSASVISIDMPNDTAFEATNLGPYDTEPIKLQSLPVAVGAADSDSLSNQKDAELSDIDSDITEYPSFSRTMSNKAKPTPLSVEPKREVLGGLALTAGLAMANVSKSALPSLGEIKYSDFQSESKLGIFN